MRSGKINNNNLLKLNKKCFHINHKLLIKINIEI